MKKIVLIFVVISILLTGFVGFSYLKKDKTRIEVLETDVVTRGDIREVLVETGIIQLQVGAQVKIGARATGVITEMRVKVGDQVKKGDLIAKIDSREIINSINLTKAQLSKVKANLEQINNTYPKKINELKQELEYASSNLKRLERLLLDDFTTKDAYEQAKTKYNVLLSNYERTTLEFESQKKILQASIKELEEQLKQYETRYTYHEIYAPIDGVVASVTAQEGETVVTGLQVANLVTIIDPTQLELWIYVDETDIGKVKVGQQVEFTVDAYNKTFYGTITSIQPQPVVKDNITYYIATLPIKKEDTIYLKPQMTAYIKIITNTKDNVLLVNNAAIKFDKGNQVVYKIYEKDKVEKTRVKIGIRGEEKTEIIEGLNEGDVVATKLILPTDKTKPKKQK